MNFFFIFFNSKYKRQNFVLGGILISPYRLGSQLSEEFLMLIVYFTLHAPFSGNTARYMNVCYVDINAAKICEDLFL